MKNEILSYCRTLGLSEIGFVRCRRFTELKEYFQMRKNTGLECEFEESDIEKRINPNIYMEEGKTIITIAFPYLYKESLNYNGFSVYTKGLDYHRVVKLYLNQIVSKINELGGEAVALVDSNSLPERYIAYLGGLGIIGKNNMLITKKYGSYVFLGEIITNLEIYNEKEEKLEELVKFTHCKDCTKCFEKCPTKAINNNRKNCNICVSYLTQKKELTEVESSLSKEMIFGCDTCQVNCPMNKDVCFSSINEFKPIDFMTKTDLEWIVNISNKKFKETILTTSCGWRGKKVIKRNTELFIDRLK